MDAEKKLPADGCCKQASSESRWERMLALAMMLIDEDALPDDSDASHGEKAKPWDFAASKLYKKNVEELQAKGIKALEKDLGHNPDDKMLKRALKDERSRIRSVAAKYVYGFGPPPSDLFPYALDPNAPKRGLLSDGPGPWTELPWGKYLRDRYGSGYVVETELQCSIT